MDLTTHLNELNNVFKVKTNLLNTMFQTITAFQLKLKLWQAQIKADNFMNSTCGLKTINPVNSGKYAALLFYLIQEFETRFKDLRENNQYFAIFVTPFSVDINMLPANFQLECIELQSDTQRKI